MPNRTPTVFTFAVLLFAAGTARAETCDFERCHRVPIRDIPALAQAGDCSCRLFQARRFAAAGEKIPYDLTGIQAGLKAAAAKNDSFALRALGDFELYGMAGPKNGPAALELYKKAADLGDEDAEQMLGALYQQGAPGIKPDFELAKHYYALAATPSSGGYMHMLAQKLSGGELGKPDNVEAAAWVLVAEKYTSDGTPGVYDEYRKELRASLSPEEQKKAAQRAGVLEKEYFKGAVPKQKLSQSELDAREERVKALAERLKRMTPEERSKEFERLLEEAR